MLRKVIAFSDPRDIVRPRSDYLSVTSQPNDSTSIPGDDKKETLSNLLRPVLDAYFSRTSKWLSLKCFDVSKDGGKNLVAFDYHKLEKKNGAITCSFLNKIGQAELAKTFIEGLKLGFSPGRRIDAKEDHQTHWNFSEEGSKNDFTVGLYKPTKGFPVVSIQSTLDVTVGATTLPGPSFSLVIIGNYLVPLHTWSISKITPVPIMKIVNNNGKLSAGSFYDCGLIVLKFLDSDARLVSVNDAEKWNSGNHNSIENFARHYLDLYETALSPEEKANMVTSFKTRGQLSRVLDNKTLTLEHLWSKTERLQLEPCHTKRQTLSCSLRRWIGAKSAKTTIAETEIVLAGEWPERLVGAVKTSDLGSEFRQCH